MSNAPSYKVFANSLIKEADEDDRVVAITAAMPDGTGLTLFEKAHPDRAFDVGIAEQHGDVLRGPAAEGFKPFAAIYSTFLQRAYDQVARRGDPEAAGALCNRPSGSCGCGRSTHAGVRRDVSGTCRGWL